MTNLRPICRVYDLVERLSFARISLGGQDIYRMLQAADNIASAATWSVVHMTYARKVYTDGHSLAHADFKPTAEDHTGDLSSLWQRGKERK